MLHDLIKDLTEYLNLTPEQQFRVSAKIKRYVHQEKASVFSRYAMYGQGHGIYDNSDPENPKLIGREEPKNPWLQNIMEQKAKQHRELSHLPDEEVITWDVGSFKYVQKIEPCSVCGIELTGKPYARVVANGVNNTFCENHIPEEMKED